ncbi:MAG: hypothetical protein JSV68_00215 [Anaerolineaceae bacterium]|nr:MAG: hypothetical protein JSV68_00215 [Anaerolineaceae bacterium]
MAEQVGRYRLIRLLGQGGMDSVYLAHDPEFDREAAVKVLPAQLANNNNFLTAFGARRAAKRNQFGQSQ